MKAKKASAILFAIIMLASLITPAAFAAGAAREQIELGEPVTYTGTGADVAPAYTFDSSLFSAGGEVGAVIFNISIDLPLEGDPSWNDWCGGALAVNAGGETKYYDYGGAQVGWGVDVDGDDEPDTGGKDSDSWVGTAANGVMTLTVPVNAADFTIDFYDNCWDSVEGSHYTIQSATALYGEVAAVEQVEVGEEVAFTGTEGADPAFVFVSSAFSKSGNVAAVAFNISIALPLEGDPSWNDWCGEALAVTANGETYYYDFGGAQVGWGLDINGDDEPDTGGKDTASWVGTAYNGALSITVPVDAEEFSIAFFDNCWDNVEDIHYVVNYATALFGSVVDAGEPPPAPPAPAVPDFDPNGEYRAFLGIQMSNWVHRDEWDSATRGENGSFWDEIGTNYFNNLYDNDEEGSRSGTFDDAIIKGNGTYRVSLVDYDFGGADAFNQLYVSTNIPQEGNPLTFSNVKVIIGGRERHVFDVGYVPGIDNTDKRDYYMIVAINIWNADIEEFNNMVPDDGEIAIEFTVSGFAYDNPEFAQSGDGDDAGTEPTELPKPVPRPIESIEDSGSGMPAWAIALIVIGGAAVIGIVIAVIMKNKKKAAVTGSSVTTGEDKKED